MNIYEGEILEQKLEARLVTDAENDPF